MLRSFIYAFSLCFMMLLPAQSVKGDEVWVLLADGYNRQEHFGSVGPLLAAGYSITIVSPGGEIVRLNRDGSPDQQGRDISADLSLVDAAELGPEGVIGLLIPGGYSPGFLEQHDAALAIVDQFIQAQKPIAAICHGPRLLMRGGHLNNRVWTGLWTLADELPNSWITSQRGAYLDQGVVHDGSLLTGRYPNDVPEFARQTITHFARHGGPGLPSTLGSFAVAAPGWSNHQRWWLEWSLRIVGHQAQVINDPQRWNPENLQDAMILQLEALDDEALSAWNEHTLPPPDPRLSGLNTVEELLPVISRLAGAEGAARAREGERRTVATAALALRHGFDDAVAISMLTQLQHLGYEVAIIADQAGWLRGLNGMPLQASTDYTSAHLAEGALIVLPGGHHPEYRSDARQGDQADWLPQQAMRDQQRHAWLMQQWQQGAHLVAIGSDSWLLTRDEPAFSGLEVSSSSQLRWAFRGEGARFNNQAVYQSHDRLLTARGFTDLPKLIPLLPAP